MSIRASIIIPTRNRLQSLRKTLDALAQQDFPRQSFEVIVVDDGSEDETPTVIQTHYPFELHMISQRTAGATLARNRGAMQSKGDFLVFLDDDIDPVPAVLTQLEDALSIYAPAIALGEIYTSSAADSSLLTKINASLDRKDRTEPYFVSRAECQTGLLAIKCDHFFSLDMFHDPTGGWPNWDDVEFGYRASCKGFNLVRCPKAIGWHRDGSMADLKRWCLRSERASHSAVVLLQKYPELFQDLAMLHDKAPISLDRDPPSLIAHKIFHAVLAQPPILWGMEKVAQCVERLAPRQTLLMPLYRWINSGYIYRGFRRGLREFGQLDYQG